MTSLKEYLLSVIVVSVFCALINSLIKEKGAASHLLKLMSGILIMIVVLKPLISFKMNDIHSYIESFSVDASFHVQQGEKTSQESYAAIIKEQTQAYILDKATSLDVDIAVDVILDTNAPYTPVTVYLRGSVSPYAKKQLSDYIAEKLAIGKEAQIWIG